MVRRRSEKEALLVSRQDVRSRDKKHDRQPEQEAVDPDPADTAQGAPALRRFSFHFQDSKQIQGGVIHLQKQRPFAVIIRRRAQQAVLVVHLCHGVNSRESRVSQPWHKEDFWAGGRQTGVLGTDEKPTDNIHSEWESAAHIPSSTESAGQNKKKAITSCVIYSVVLDVQISKTSDIFKLLLPHASSCVSHSSLLTFIHIGGSQNWEMTNIVKVSIFEPHLT